MIILKAAIPPRHWLYRFSAMARHCPRGSWDSYHQSFQRRCRRGCLGRFRAGCVGYEPSGCLSASASCFHAVAKIRSTYPSPDTADQSQIVASREIVRPLIVHRASDTSSIQVAKMALKRRRRLPTGGGGGTAGGASGSASADVGLPKLAQFLAQLLSCRCPVGLNAVT